VRRTADTPCAVGSAVDVDTAVRALRDGAAWRERRRRAAAGVTEVSVAADLTGVCVTADLAGVSVATETGAAGAGAATASGVGSLRTGAVGT